MKSLVTMAAAAILLVAVPAPAAALPAPKASEQSNFALSLPAEQLATSLRELGKVTASNIVFNPAVIAGHTASPLKGNYSVKQALAKLLKGTGLRAVFTGPSTVVIEVSPRGTTSSSARSGHAQADVKTLKKVTVIGQAPELSATRADLPTKEIPQSVSVISQQTIEQQNATDLPSALQQEPGITLMQNDSQQTYITSRGFQVDSVHINGGSPVALIGGSIDASSRDIAEFDNIEVLRGSDALFGGMGNPGATVSMQRKEPTPDFEADFSAAMGSWSQNRIVGDVGGPITDKLGGRLVVSSTDGDNFYDTTSSYHKMIYGVLQYKLGSATTVSFGGSYERVHGVLDFMGLPWYDNGVTPDLPRSLALTVPWATSKNSFTEGFAKLEHNFNKSWKLQINATYLKESLEKMGTIFYGGPINSSTNLLDTQFDGLQPLNSTGPDTQKMMNATVTGAFDWLGHKQRVMFGGDFERQLFSGDISEWPSFGPVINPFDFDPNMYPKPDLSPSKATFNETYPDLTIQWGIYAAFRFVPIDHLAITFGGRLSTYRVHDITYLSLPAYDLTLPTTTTSYGDYNKFTPYAGITYDVGKHYTIYASYTDIYHDNAGELMSNETQLPPSNGNTMELGIKTDWFNNTLNGSFDLFKTNETGVGVYDPSTPASATGTCCYVPGTVKAKGLDVQIRGAITPRWQLVAGYTFNKNLNSSSFIDSELPKNVFKLWTNYNLPGEHWSLGGGVRAFSANYVSECYPDSDPCGQYVPFGQKFYAVADLRVAYVLNDHWSAALNVNNIFDRKYYQTVSELENGNWYGAPTNFMFKVNCKL